jgi:hypothetical protein
MSLGLKPSKKGKELVAALKALRHPKLRHPIPETPRHLKRKTLRHPKTEVFSKLFSYEIGDPNP